MYFFNKTILTLVLQKGSCLNLLFLGPNPIKALHQPPVPKQIRQHHRRRASTVPTSSRCRYEQHHSRRRRGTSPTPTSTRYHESRKDSESPERYIRQSLSWLFRIKKERIEQCEVCLCDSSQWFMHHLRLVEKCVPGDGNCAFRSIAQAFFNGEIRNIQQETEVALRLRQLASEELLKRKNDVTDPSLGLTIEGVVMTMCECRSYQDYVQKVRTVQYAGEIELLLLAQRLHVMISIYKPSRDHGGSFERIWRSSERMTDDQGDLKELRLVWHQGATELCNHYNALLPVLEEL